MKFIELENVSKSQIVIKPARLTFKTGEKKKVHPCMLAYPSIGNLIGNGLLVVSKEEAPVVEPKAPEPTTPAKVEPIQSKVSEPIATPSTGSTKADNDSTAESVDQSSGQNLREIYISAPGITEDNVDAILEVYPVFDELKKATKAKLLELGVHKSQAKKLVSWVADQ